MEIVGPIVAPAQEAIEAHPNLDLKGLERYQADTRKKTPNSGRMLLRLLRFIWASPDVPAPVDSLRSFHHD